MKEAGLELNGEKKNWFRERSALSLALRDKVATTHSKVFETKNPVDMEVLGDLGNRSDVKSAEIPTSDALGLPGGTTRGRSSRAWAFPKMQLGSATVGVPRRGLIAALITSLLMLWGFNASALSEDMVTVAAAANLSPILPALEKAFAKTDPTPLRFVVGSSGKLTTQILRGAPFDVFLSADESHPSQLQARGLCVDGPRVYAKGILVLVFRENLASAAFPAGLDWSRVDRLAIADPSLAPYGRAAVEYLEHGKCAAEFSGRRVMGQSIGQTAQFVLSGSVDAGFLALSQVKAFSDSRWKWTIVPEDQYKAIRQAAVLLKRERMGTTAAAAAFFDFLFSPDAVAIFREAGYRSPELRNDATDPS